MTCERCTLTDDETEAVRRHADNYFVTGHVEAVLRRLLPDERVEHRLVFGDGFADESGPTLGTLICSCGWQFTGILDAAVRAWARHAVAEGEML